MKLSEEMIDTIQELKSIKENNIADVLEQVWLKPIKELESENEKLKSEIEAGLLHYEYELNQKNDIIDKLKEDNEELIEVIELLDNDLDAIPSIISKVEKYLKKSWQEIIEDK